MIKGTTIGIRIDEEVFDTMHVTVRFTVSKEKYFQEWVDRLGADQMYEVGDV